MRRASRVAFPQHGKEVFRHRLRLFLLSPTSCLSSSIVARTCPKHALAAPQVVLRPEFWSPVCVDMILRSSPSLREPIRRNALPTPKSQSGNRDPVHHGPAHHRPHLIVLFAIMMMWFAANASAAFPEGTFPLPIQLDPPAAIPVQTSGTLQWDATHLGVATPLPDFFDPMADHRRPFDRLAGRPVSVDMTSWLANFDADADPDGWRAEIVLRDDHGHPVVMRAHAKFELIARLPMGDHHHFINAQHKSITWSMPLRLDERGVASVKLPLRRSQEAKMGWSSSIHSSHSSPFHSVGSHRHRPFTYRVNGIMRVRVSVPTEGVFEAVTPVRLRPSFLIDARRSY